MSSKNSHSANDTISSDLERQRVENYPGRLIAGRYYLRPSKSSKKSLGSQLGTGFALGGNSYNVEGRKAKRTPCFFEDTEQKPVSSNLVRLSTSEVSRIRRRKPNIHIPTEVKNNNFLVMPWRTDLPPL